ncbi:MAG: NADP-dependent oxidoreductase [Kiloniellales bacterium]|nr:NADP-dependent oxidoreductase [Kiloniellales bacterium]
MSENTNHQVLLVARPEGGVREDCFRLEAAPRPEPGPGQLLVRVIYLSLDPAMRGWISEAPNYREALPLGSVMTGFTVGEVAASRHPDYAVGDVVLGRQGWREWAVSDGSDVHRKLDPAEAPISTALHVLGHTGLTAYLGLTEVGRPAAGETVMVSTAAGAVGSMVGQIAKLKGCRSVGLTGSDEKVARCRTDFGYDAAINYKTAADLEAAIAAACPDGIDVYFDNVGGPISDAVLERINVGARIIVCGTMGIPDGGPDDPPPLGPRPNRQLLIRRARMEGFLVLDHLASLDRLPAELVAWVRDGKLGYREDRVQGLENAASALLRLLSGQNLGKMIVQVAADPTLSEG